LVVFQQDLDLVRAPDVLDQESEAPARARLVSGMVPVAAALPVSEETATVAVLSDSDVESAVPARVLPAEDLDALAPVWGSVELAPDLTRRHGDRQYFHFQANQTEQFHSA
jgi:hypothetical protein